MNLRLNWIASVGIALIVFGAFRACAQSVSKSVDPDADRTFLSTSGVDMRGPRASMNSSEIVKMLGDVTIPFEVRFGAFDRLSRLSFSNRCLALEQVVENPNETISTTAARMALQEKDPLSASIIEKQFSKWSEFGQAGIMASVLENIPDTEQPSGLFSLARHILSQGTVAVADAKTSALVDQIYGFAALCLYGQLTTDDSKEVQLVLTHHSQSASLWYIIATGTMSPDDVRLGVGLFGDKTTPEQLKFAVAVALAPGSKDASSYLESAITHYLKQYGGMRPKDFIGLMLYASDPYNSNATVGGESVSSIAINYLDGFTMIATLRYLHTDTARSMTIAALHATDTITRQVASLVAGERWPDELLLNLDKDKCVKDEYIKTMAFLVKKHPEYRPQVIKLISEVTLDDEMKALNSAGFVATFGPVASAFLGG